MFNKIILVGNLTRDIELRYTQGGSAVASTAIATTKKYKAQDGTQKEEVCFVDITFFGRTGEIANQYLKRGSKVLVEGRLKLDQWTDANGGKRSKHSVTVDNLQMLDSKSDNQQGGYTQKQATDNYSPSNNRGASQSQTRQAEEFPEIDNSEELPF